MRGPALSKSVQNAEQKRIDIVRSAESLFLGQGYAVTSMDRIADAAGVTKQTVYRYFPAKEALFVAVMEHVRASSDAGRYVFSSGTLTEELTGFGRHLLAFHLQPRVLGLYRLMLTEGAQSKLLPGFMAAGSQPVLHALQELLERHSVDRTDLEFKAQMFTAMVLAPRNHLLMSNKLRMPRALQESHVRKVVEFFCHGLGA